MSEKQVNALVLDERDNIAIVTQNLKEGDVLVLQTKTGTIKIQDDIPKGHKVAATFISMDESVVKYGESLGIATQDIKAGSHVHTNNVRGLRKEEREAVRASMNEEESR